jgi:hypothetical protein
MKSVVVMAADRLSVEPLTDVEIKWVKRLQRTLAACPGRLELVTIGDPYLCVVDREGARKSELADGAAEADGVVLANVDGGPIIHGVSG